MQRSAAILFLVFAFATGAFAQATLRIGDPVELKVGGVPAEDQNQVNNTYTVDSGGTLARDRRELSLLENLHEPERHHSDAAERAVRERWRFRPQSVACAVH